MAVPQPGIFALGARSHLHLELEVTGDPTELPGIVSTIREAGTTVVGVNVVVGFGHRTWQAIAPDHMPSELVGFEPIEGAGDFVIPAAQRDLWLWLHASTPDAIFDIARVAARELKNVARVVTERVCFTYGASQDLTGFEDGTENPPVDEALYVATIPAGEPCGGGSYVLLQRWVHDLDGFEALETADREQVIGRTLHGSVELDADLQPPNSHVSRVVIEDDKGHELEVFRRSVAYGGVDEHGLMFVAFSADRSRLQRMLERMAGREDGLRDRLTEFSTPVASAWYVAPPVDLLRSLE